MVPSFFMPMEPCVRIQKDFFCFCGFFLHKKAREKNSPEENSMA
jgi:hypothetical protein